MKKDLMPGQINRSAYLWEINYLKSKINRLHNLVDAHRESFLSDQKDPKKHDVILPSDRDVILWSEFKKEKDGIR